MPDEFAKYKRKAESLAAEDVLFGGGAATEEAIADSLAQSKLAEAQKRAEEAERMTQAALSAERAKALQAAKDGAEREHLEEVFQREQLELERQAQQARREEVEKAERVQQQQAEKLAEESNLRWKNIGANLLKPCVILDIFIFTIGVSAADIGSDIAVTRTFLTRRYYVFCSIAICLLIIPMCMCWFRFYVDGKAKWYEAPLYVLQVKTLQEVYEALKSEDGRKGFDLLFISVCEVCFESFPQSLLATYALLIGINLNSGEGLFGFPAVRIFEVSIFISWCTAARFLATMDEYRPETNSVGSIPFPLKLARIAFRFSEISVRVLSLAFFAAIMRPAGLRSHENGQVAVWYLLAVDFCVMYTLCRYIAGEQKNSIVYAGICVVCAPMHFIPTLQKILDWYYAVRVLELLGMTTVVLVACELDEILPTLGRDTSLWITARVCSGLFLGLLLLNFLLAQFLPESRLCGGGSWLIVPRYLEPRASSDDLTPLIRPSGDSKSTRFDSEALGNVEQWNGSGVLKIDIAMERRKASTSKSNKLFSKKGDKYGYVPLANENV